MKQVESKLPAATKYVATWTRGLPSAPHSVLVHGGLRRDALTVTSVTDADAAFLAAHPHFQEHAARGFVKIVEAAA